MAVPQTCPVQMIATLANRPKYPTPCRYYHRRHGCLRANECRYQHIYYSQIPSSSSSPLPSPSSSSSDIINRLNILQQQYEKLYDMILRLLSTDHSHGIKPQPLLPTTPNKYAISSPTTIPETQYPATPTTHTQSVTITNINAKSQQTNTVNKKQHIPSTKPTPTSSRSSTTTTTNKKYKTKQKKRFKRQQQRSKKPQKIQKKPATKPNKKNTKKIQKNTKISTQNNTVQTTTPAQEKKADFLHRKKLNSEEVVKENKDGSNEEEHNENIDKKKAERLKTEGNDYVRQKKYEEAILKYEEAMKLDPENPVYLTNIAAVYHRQKQYQQSLETAFKATKMDPYYTKSHLRVGLAAFALKNWHVASEYLNIVIMDIEKSKENKDEIECKNIDKYLEKYQEMVQECDDALFAAYIECD